jgi:hypothetical protein
VETRFIILIAASVLLLASAVFFVATVVGRRGASAARPVRKRSRKADSGEGVLLPPSEFGTRTAPLGGADLGSWAPPAEPEAALILDAPWRDEGSPGVRHSGDQEISGGMTGLQPAADELEAELAALEVIDSPGAALMPKLTGCDAVEVAAPAPEPAAWVPAPAPEPVPEPEPEPAAWVPAPAPEPVPAPEPEPAAWVPAPALEPAAWVPAPALEPAAWVPAPAPEPVPAPALEPAAWEPAVASPGLVCDVIGSEPPVHVETEQTADLQRQPPSAPELLPLAALTIEPASAVPVEPMSVMSRPFPSMPPMTSAPSEPPPVGEGSRAVRSPEVFEDPLAYEPEEEPFPVIATDPSVLVDVGALLGMVTGVDDAPVLLASSPGGDLGSEVRCAVSDVPVGVDVDQESVPERMPPSAEQVPAGVDVGYRMVAPVELGFSGSEHRVGIRPGTPTFLKYQRLAGVLMADLRKARAARDA